MADEHGKKKVLEGRQQEERFFDEVAVPALEAFGAQRPEGTSFEITFDPNVVAIVIEGEHHGEWRCEVSATPKPGFRPFVEASSHYEGKPDHQLKDYWAHDIGRQAIMDWLAAAYQQHQDRNER